MGLTSEQVHWIFGFVLFSTGSFILAYNFRLVSAVWLRYLLPVVLTILSVELLLDPLLHGDAAPDSYGAETAQHTALGIMLLVVSMIEYARMWGKLSHLIWAMILPAGMVIAGTVFILHAQHDANVPMILLMTQHRIIGVTMITLGLVKALGEFPKDWAKAFHLTWPLLLIILGTQFLLYTEGQTLFGNFSMSENRPTPAYAMD